MLILYKSCLELPLVVVYSKTSNKYNHYIHIMRITVPDNKK